MGHSNGHICQCLSGILALRNETVVTVSGDRRRTGKQFVDGVLSLARGLSELGVESGDVVAIAALNSEWYMEWLLAVAFVGGIAAPLNYRWSTEEARTAVEIVKPVMLVVDESCRKWIAELQVPSLRFHVLIAESPFIISPTGSVTDEGSIKRALEEPPSFDYLWAPMDVALICFTSGTTGRPKGIAISHMSLIVQALAKLAIVGYDEDDVYLHTAPLCHIGGISSCITVLMAGCCHIFIPRFDAKAAIQAIEQNQVTSLITVPAMMADLILSLRTEIRWDGGKSVRKVLNGGGSLSSELTVGAIHIFPEAKLISAYGMTEACSSLTFKTLHDPTSKTCGKITQNNQEAISEPLRSHLGGICVGKPPSHIELQISSSNTNSGPSSAGRILTRGAHVMVGYWNCIARTRSATGPWDWLDTGDIGWIDASGCLWLLGRTKDRIKSGGENIYPNEVEAVLLHHPGVSSVVVVGIPDYRLTEMVVACLCLKENWEWVDQKKAHSTDLKELSSEILQKHCQQRNLTRFKIPKLYIPWRKPFLYTSTGKLKREEVRKEAMSYLQFLPSNL